MRLKASLPEPDWDRSSLQVNSILRRLAVQRKMLLKILSVKWEAHVPNVEN